MDGFLRLGAASSVLERGTVNQRHLKRNRKFVDLYGSFSVKWLFGLLPVFCSERKGRFSSRRLRSGSRSARKGSRDRNASVA